MSSKPGVYYMVVDFSTECPVTRVQPNAKKKNNYFNNSEMYSTRAL